MKFKDDHGEEGFEQLLFVLEKEVNRTEEGRKDVADVKRQTGETERKVLEGLPPGQRSHALAAMSPEHRSPPRSLSDDPSPLAAVSFCSSRSRSLRFRSSSFSFPFVVLALPSLSPYFTLLCDGILTEPVVSRR